MSRNELTSVLEALNSTVGMFKYPIGNKELTIKVRQLESDGKIIYNALDQKWYKRASNILKQLKG